MDSARALQPRDFGLILAFCALVLGIALVRGRELSVHEAVLPQSARTMLADGDWMVPKKGSHAWLENPPLPQWATVALAAPFGRCDQLFIVRLAPVFAGTLVCLMCAWIGARLFGRRVGLLAGLTSATTYEIARYSWLAEDEIFLCALVTMTLACFVRLEFESASATPVRPTFFGTRSPGVLLLFLTLGLTNLVKGPGFGTALALAPIALFLLLGGGRIRTYVWFWGWLLFVGLASFWPIWVWRTHPDAFELWDYLYLGRVTGDYSRLSKPFWYYALALTWTAAPWILVVPFGLKRTAHSAQTRRTSPERFLWCWALGIPLVLSIPDGKHHHYLLCALPAWSLLGAIGLLHLGQRWASGHPKRDARRAAAWAFGLIATALLATHAIPRGTHHEDARFLRAQGRSLPTDAALFVDLEVGALRGFHCLFYLPDSARPLHNLSFLRDERITAAEAYVITRFERAADLADYGQAEVLAQSKRSGHSNAPEARMTLFRLVFHPDLARLPAANVHVSPMQSMYLAEGPHLVPARSTTTPPSTPAR